MKCPHCQADNPPGSLRCSSCGKDMQWDANTPTGGASDTWIKPATGVDAWMAESGGESNVLGGRYEVLEMLGEGGMGAVYKARDRELDRLIAVKIIRPELAAQRDVLSRFKQELILARKITHKNVIRIYDLGEARGTKFITMEYIEGHDLKALLRSKTKFPPAEALPIMQQVCRALAAAHAEGVVHRDMKPQNIMIDGQGVVIVMDFGIARSLEASGMTRTGALMGTPEYMSPEQAKGEDLDARSDLFSLGIIFYEMVTGQLPFKADTMMGTLFKRTEGRAAPPNKIDPALPDALNDLIVKCLEPKPQERYQDAREILRDLDSRQGTRGDGATPLSLPGLPTPALPAKRKTWIAAAAGVVVLLITTAILLRDRVFPKPVPRSSTVTVLVSDFTNTTGDAVFDGTLEPALTLALEGASFITSFPPSEAHRIAAQIQPNSTKLDESLARLVAVRQGINVIVSGSIAKQDAGYRVTVKAVDAVHGKEIASQKTDITDKAALLAAVGKLAAPIRKALGDTPPATLESASAETFTSTSLEASHEYAKAQELQWWGKSEEALGHYEQAIKLDPEFGRAYAGLAAIHANQGHRQDAEKYYQMAMARIQRMTDREKYRTRGGYYLAVRNHPQAIEEFNSLVKQYPGDSAGRANLALAYAYSRNMPRAMEEGRKALETRPNSLLYRNNFALYAAYAGDDEIAAKEAETVLQANPAYVKAYVALAISQMARGQTSQAAKTYAKLEKVSSRGASWAAAGLADAALYEGRQKDAIGILEKAVAADLAEKEQTGAASKAVMLAEAYLTKGQKGPAIAAAERALASSTQEGILFSAARIYRQAGQEAKARALASQLSSRLEPEPQAYGKLAEGELLMQRADFQGAIRLMHEAQKLSDTWLGRLDLGIAYLGAKAYTEASSELDLCLRRRGEASAVFLDEVSSFRYLPLAYYYLGRVQDGLKRGSGVESFRTFLNIKSHDEGDPLVQDARKLLAAH